MVQIHVGDTTGGAGGADERYHHGIRYVNHTQVYMLSRLNAAGVADNLLGELFVARVSHGISPVRG